MISVNGSGTGTSRICSDTTCDTEEFLCLSPHAHFSAMTELHLSTDGVKMNKFPQKCKVDGKIRLWCSDFPLQLAVSQWFRFQALCHRAVLVRYWASYQNQIRDHDLVFFFSPFAESWQVQEQGKSSRKSEHKMRTMWENYDLSISFVELNLLFTYSKCTLVSATAADVFVLWLTNANTEIWMSHVYIAIHCCIFGTSISVLVILEPLGSFQQVVSGAQLIFKWSISSSLIMS